MKRLISMGSAAVLLAGAMFLPSLLRADDHKEGRPEAREEGGEGHWGKKLGLSEDQEGKMKALKRAHREAEESARAEMGASVRKLKDQLEDKAAEKDLSATLDKLQAGRRAMQAEQEKFETAMAAILTPTQRARLVVGMAGRMHGGMPGRDGKRGHGDKDGGKKDSPD